jgi:cold shock CspA family protein
MSEPYQGEVISWTHSFGFIRPDGAAQDLFFHVSHTVSGERVRRGARVVFFTEPDNRRPDKQMAVNVRLQGRP